MKSGINSAFNKFFLAITGFEPRKLYVRKEHIKRNVVAFVRFKQWPMFHWVQIETSSYCNRKCEGCPVSLYPREKKYISETIFTKIVNELVGLSFSGTIHLHSFNEPLADRTIVDKVRLISKSLPKAKIKMNSNGDFLTPKLLRQLLSAGLDRLYVTQYDGKINERIANVLKEIDERERAIMTVRVKTAFLGNRAGLLSNIVVQEPILAGCNRPFNQLVINYKGDIVICCNDYLEKEVMGNVEDATLLDIWNCDRFKSIRRLLRMKNRNSIGLCNRCNFMGDICEYRDLSNEEISKFNAKARLEARKWKILPKMLQNPLDILRAHYWLP